MKKKQESINFVRSIAQSPLLVTKLHVPRARTRLVMRPRLFKELDEGVRNRVTMVVAPAGYGKTTAVAEWIGQRGFPAGWISLDSGDSEPAHFWRYLISALEPVLPKIGGKLANFLHSIGSSPLKTLITLLIDDLHTQPRDFVLVLDNYHVINNSAIHKSIALLFEYMPENLHIILVSRAVPPIELPLFKARGQLKEIGSRELGFSLAEAVTFYEQQSLRLSRDDVEILHKRTEGWAAGLYIAALALGQQGDKVQLVQNLSGNNHDFAAYLKQEVFQNWPEDIQEFLLQTSVLNYLTAPLCNKVTGRKDSHLILENLAASNSFVVTLDREKGWYRYHHLFAEFLKAQLCKSSPSSLNLLYRQAGVWYEQNGYLPEAIGHFICGSDFTRAALLLEEQGPAMLRQGSAATIQGILELMPEAVLEHSPVLCLIYAWALILSGEAGAAERWLGQVEHLCLDGAKHQQPTPACGELLGEVLLARASASYNDLARAMDLLQEAYRRLPAGSSFLSLDLWSKAGFISIIRGFFDHTGTLTDIKAFYREAQPVLEHLGCDYGSGFYSVVSGEVAYELNELDQAMRLGMEGIKQAETAGEAGVLIPGLVILARIRRARGDLDGALDTVREAEKRANALNAFYCLPQLTAFRVRLYIERHDLEPVEQWVQHNNLSIYDRPSIEREYEHLTLARALMTQQRWDQAQLCLTRLLVFAEEKKRHASIIEVLNLQAMIYLRQGEHDKAMNLMQKSLALAEAGGNLRIFVDEGHPMLDMLANFSRWQRKQRSSTTKVSAQYIKKLLRLIKDSAATGSLGQLPKGKAPTWQPEALTRREIEVLRLLSQGLTYREIAAKLTVSLSTVKTYTSNIFSKLGVNNRTLAVERAQEYNIP